MCSNEQDLFWGITRNTIFTVISTWIVFFLGHLLTRRNESKKERKRLSDLKIFTKTTLDLLCAQSIEQKKAFIALIGQLSNKRYGGFFRLQRISNPHLISIGDVASADLYKIFVADSKNVEQESKEYGNLQSALQTLRIQTNKLSAEFENFLLTVNDCINQYSEHIIKVNETLNSIHVELSADMQKQSPYSELLEVIKKTKNNPDSANVFFSSDILLLPLFSICQNNKNESVCFRLLPHLMQCIRFSQKIEDTQSAYRTSIELDVKHLDESVEVIRSFVQKH